MACCLVIHIVLSVQIANKADELESTAKELVNYYIQHPYLKLDSNTKKLLFGESQNEEVEKMLNTYRRREARKIHLFKEEEQDKLDQMAQKLKNILADVPYRKYGYIPAEKNYMGLLTYMFIHGGWLHLIGNLLLLYLTGPFIEDLWGRPIFTAFYVMAGVFSGYMFSLYYPNFTGPLIGASGAIAGLMGAFLIKFWRTKIKFFFFIFIFHGTFKAPAWLMLPIWLALEIFSANSIDSVNADGGGVAHWAHIWGFLLGVVAAALMKRFKIEEKYVEPKIEAQVHFVDEGYKAFEEATKKINDGQPEEAYALLITAARKNPRDKEVVEALWSRANELGKEKEGAEFYARLIESEIRSDQMEAALVHFMDLKEKVPQASLSMTCKFTLMTYLTERQEYKEAKELAKELVEEVDLNSSPGLLQNFANAVSKHSPEIAKKVIELCLKHPGIPDEQKDILKTRLKELQSRLTESPPPGDMGEAHAAGSDAERMTAELERQLGLKPESQPPVDIESPPGAQSEVQPLADSVGQTREELIGQLDVNPEVKPPVVSDIQYKTQPEGQPAIKQDSQPGLSPETQPLGVPQDQPGEEPKDKPAVDHESPPGIQPLADTVNRAVEEPLGHPEAEPEDQQRIESESQSGLSPETQPVAEPESQSGLKPEVQPLADTISRAAEEPVEPQAVETEVQQRVATQGQSESIPEVQPFAKPESQQEVESYTPEATSSPDPSIMAINAIPLNVKDGKIELNMNQIGQELIPLNEVKSIAVAEIAPDQKEPFVLVDLFLDDPKTNNQKVRTIRLLSTTFDPTKFSPGIQDHQDALKVFVSVLLKLSGATAYPDEDSILLEAPQSFSSVEDYEKSILS
ncbi:MAG: rhomboid family intramembrane serine protease [Candidatus Aminicenantes bacterium]|nr:rhomboid family intramembrane serine protease [Candidatus Aminicenantes bacterium]